MDNSQLDSTYDWCGCGISTAAIVGIVIASLAIAVIIGSLIYCWIRRKNKNKDDMRNTLVTVMATKDES